MKNDYFIQKSEELDHENKKMRECLDRIHRNNQKMFELRQT